MSIYHRAKNALQQSDLFSQYKSVVGYGLINKALLFFSGYISVILLNRILGKELFGELVFFQSVFAYLIIISILGFDKTIIYKLSGHSEKGSDFIGRGLLFKFLKISIFATLFFEITFALLWFSLGKATFSHDSFWVFVLSINSIMIVLNSLYDAYFQANKQAAKTIKVSNIISLTRVSILGLLFVFGLKDLQYLASYILLPSLLNVFWFHIITTKSSNKTSNVIVKTSDYTYSFKMMFTRFAHVGIEKIDLIMIGLFLSATDVAEYAIAAKIALIVGLGNDLLSPLLSPRLKFQIENGTTHDINKEYQFNRYFSLAIAFIVLVLLTFFGETILDIFGDYGNSYNILCLLGLAFTNKVAFGPNGRYLALKGYSNITLISSILLLSVMVFANFILINIYGQTGAAIATLLSLLLLNIFFQLYIFKYDKIKFLSISDYLFIGLVNSLILLYVFER